MSNVYIYNYEDSRGRDKDIEIHYEYVKGHPGHFGGLPDNWSPPEGPEVNILYFVDPRTGNEILDDELEVPIETIVEAIIDYHEEGRGDDY